MFIKIIELGVKRTADIDMGNQNVYIDYSKIFQLANQSDEVQTCPNFTYFPNKFSLLLHMFYVVIFNKYNK